MIVCQVCGTENPDGTQYCEGCGVELKAQDQSGAPVGTTPPVADTNYPATGDGGASVVAPSSAATPEPVPQTDFQPEAAGSPTAPDAGAAPAGTVPATAVEYPPLDGDSTLPGEAPTSFDGQAAPPVQAGSPAATSDSAVAVAPVEPVEAPVSLATDSQAASASVITPAQSQPASAPAEPPAEQAVVPVVPAAATTPAAGAGPAVNPRLLTKALGALTGTATPLYGDRLVVGRFDPSTGPVDIDLSGQPGAEHVSRKHGELFLENGRWMVRDLGSTNGIYVRSANDSSFGPRIQSPHPLSDGDEIAFGNIKFVYREGADSTQAGAPAGSA
jgi:hypothetical protein